MLLCSFTACGSAAHPLMSSSCLLQLHLNDWGPAEPGRSSPAGQKISHLRLHANLSCCGEKRLGLSLLSHPVGFASSPMVVQLICLLCFNSYMQRKKLPNDDLLVVTLEGPPGGPQELFQPQTGPKNKNLWKCNTAILCITV